MAVEKQVTHIFDSSPAGSFGEMNRAIVIDFESNEPGSLTSWIIGQFGHVNDGIHVLQILQRTMAKVLDDGQRRPFAAPIEGTVFVEAAVRANARVSC